MKITESHVEDILTNHQDKAVRYIKIGQGRWANMMYVYPYIAKESTPEWAEVVKFLNGKLTNTVKRARNMGWACDLTLDYLAKLWLTQEGRCAISRVVMQVESGSLDQKALKAISIDRINNDRGYVKGNVRLLTHWVNNAKSTYTDEDLKEMILATAQALT